jgi:hypothetical protein
VNAPDLGRLITKDSGIASRFSRFLGANSKAPGIKLLRDTWNFGVKQLKFDADSGDHWRVQLGMVYSLFD